MKLSKNQWLILLGCGFVTLIILMFIALYHRNHVSPKEINQDLEYYAKTHKIFSQGESSAKHHMYVFTDFKCGHCYTFHDKTYRHVIKPMIERGDVKYTEIQLPVVDEGSYQYAQMMRAIVKTGHHDIYYPYSELAYQHHHIDSIFLHTLHVLYFHIQQLQLSFLLLSLS